MARHLAFSASIFALALLFITSCRPPVQAAATGPSAVIELANDADFDQTLKDQELVMVDFNATWCGPCQMLKPTIAALSNDYKGKMTVLSVDVDKHETLASQFDISSIPAVLVFYKGEQKARIVGTRDRETYEAVVRPLAAQVSPPAEAPTE